MLMTDSEWMSDFRNRIADSRVPLSGTLELTSRCNLKCVHCYLGPQEEQWKKRSQEMSTEKVLGIIDEMVAAGTLYLLITGGDPMVHRDFPKVYRYAREQGLLVTVFCDGILVNEEILSLFRELPPAVVEVSLYGATPETYEAVTRVKGSYPKALRGIQRLLDSGIRVSLKTVLMTVNQHELPGMRDIAESLGVSFRMDNAIFPCLPNGGKDANGSKDPVQYRVSPKEAVRAEMSDPKKAREWVQYVEKRKDTPRGETTYRCGAGVTSFHVDPFGYASPCLMTTQYRHSLHDSSFKALWDRELVQLRSHIPREDYGCNSCEMQVACSGCPGFNFQETGQEDVKSDYVCETTNERWQAIQLLVRKTQTPGVGAAKEPK
jgi:radical SAM protein with 4Fe4S-binding SPASM domain